MKIPRFRKTETGLFFSDHCEAETVSSGGGVWMLPVELSVVAGFVGTGVWMGGSSSSSGVFGVGTIVAPGLGREA